MVKKIFLTSFISFVIPNLTTCHLISRLRYNKDSSWRHGSRVKRRGRKGVGKMSNEYMLKVYNNKKMIHGIYSQYNSIKINTWLGSKQHFFGSSPQDEGAFISLSFTTSHAMTMVSNVILHPALITFTTQRCCS